MLKKVFFGIVYCLATACHTSNENSIVNQDSLVLTSSNYQINNNIYKMTKIFFDTLKNKNCIYELFIDKVYENKTILTFKAKPKVPDYFTQNKPLFVYYYNKTIPIYIYTGAEDLLVGNMKKSKENFKADITTFKYYLCMSFTMDNNAFHIDTPCHKPFGIYMKEAPKPDIDVSKYENIK